MSDEQLLALAAAHRFGSIATRFPGVGDPAELRHLAWWGSALADIGCAAGGRARSAGLLADAARFYVAVALFDDAVDRAPERASVVAPPLHPRRLRGKLERPSAAESRLTSSDPDASLVVALFDAALEGIGRRLAREPRWRDEVVAMLDAMYCSELGLSRDRMAAKVLPFTLIGHLALGQGEAAPRAFFAHLARLLAMWDDWLDLVADAWAPAPNAFLGETPANTASGRLRGVARAAWLSFSGMIPGREVSRRLLDALETTLDSSARLPVPAHSKTRALLLHMLGVHGVPGGLSERPRGARARPASAARPSGTERAPAPGSA